MRFIEVSFVWNFQNSEIKMFSFLPLINNPVTIGLGFLLLSISAIISLNTINIFGFLFRLYFSIF